MEQLWSMSTTIREAERIVGFLQTAAEIEGKVWNDETQAKFQVLLVKNRQYLCDPDNKQIYNRLNDEQCELLRDKSIKMTYEQAEGIIKAKNYVGGPAMRGRQSMSPLYKLGLVYIIDEKVKITDVGRRLLNEEINFGDFMLDAMLKFQYPNPEESSYKTWNTKPFINTLRLIKKVNDLCVAENITPKGITRIEFGIFVLSMRSFSDVDKTAADILKFRKEYNSFSSDEEREQYRCEFINTYLADFKNPEKNTSEYTDNMIRYMRLTKYIYIRGKYAYTYVDLEPRRMIEIDSILKADDGQAADYSIDDWHNYMGTYGAYPLPFETIDKLTKILSDIDIEIANIEDKLGMTHTTSAKCVTREELKAEIDNRRAYRTRLQNLEIKADYHNNTNKIDETIIALNNILTHNKTKLVKKYSVELEKWAHIALNIINDSKFIKPNAPVGDDNEPTYTAPNGVPDIECFYEQFNAICEVTMLTSRDQWYNEGQPVMRHLRTFENQFEKDSYCLFIAPRLHQDTVNTFYFATKYEYEGKKQRILPITISQLIKILQTIKEMTDKHKKFTHNDLLRFYDECVDMSEVSDSTVWLDHIKGSLNSWTTELCK